MHREERVLNEVKIAYKSPESSNPSVLSCILACVRNFLGGGREN